MLSSVYRQFCNNRYQVFDKHYRIEYTQPNVDSLLEGFNAIRLKEGYSIGSFCHIYSKLKSTDNWNTALYVHRSDAHRIYKDNFETLRYISRKLGRLSLFYKEHMIIEDALYSDRFVEALKRPLDFFEVDFTPEGIAEAYFIHDHESYLPCMWHAAYKKKTILIGESDYYNLPPIYQKEIRKHKIEKPSIQIKGDTAELSFTYFSTGDGISSYKVIVHKFGKTVIFDNPTISKIYEDDYPMVY